ncbi:(Na+)-NQR maturation NqrM [Gilvimarinus xylanilyticus]|uniref:(Na+)-NQR maturation NqrM n=1 Tax=Gilvimarinus xylanilyticus TaxID=2944139 RepID=A0A9X2KT45_9GAMM|nr:(Na+)-NQR maturation NqrM [Gilvimarinus xylanilyticus]MCP8898797.1 (Na+)-NQR maturation NqrM [Gilvimarinus xylanilyticus]
MAMFMVALCVMLLVVAGMAVGVIFGRKPLSGSCGGVGQALGEKDYTCELCGGDEAKCESINSEENSAKTANQDLAVDATRPR